jgi:hypothetical protein
MRAFIVGNILGYLALLPAFLVFPDFNFDFSTEIVISTIYISCIYVVFESQLRRKRLQNNPSEKILSLKLGIILYGLSFVWPIFQGLTSLLVLMHVKPSSSITLLLLSLVFGPGLLIFLFLRYIVLFSFLESRAFAISFNMISLGLTMIWAWFFLTHFITYAASHYPSSSIWR